jgi:PhnB protein
MPVADQFYGHRTGTLLDPFGHKWTIGTLKQKVSWPEMQKRADDMVRQAQQQQQQ